MAKAERRFNPFLEGRNYPEFSREDIEAFYDGFVQFDTDNSGALDKKEFAQALKFMGQACPPDKLDAFFSKVDTDGSGYIEWGEFLAIMSIFYELRRRQVLTYYYTIARAFPQFTKKDINAFIAAFHEFDADGSGALDVMELEQCFKSMGLGFNKQTVQALLSNLDVDGSGVLEWPEFLSLLSLLFDSYREDFEREFYEPAKEFTEFSQDDIDAMIIAFREFDADGSGSLDTIELLEVFKFMGQRCTKDQLTFVLDKYDTDRSGTINWKEFLHIIRDFYQGTLNQPTQATQKAVPATSATKTNTAAPAKATAAPTKTTTPAPAKATAAPAKTTAAAPAKTTAASPAKSNTTPAPASSSTTSSASSSSTAPARRDRFGTATRVDTASLKAKFEALSKKN